MTTGTYKYLQLYIQFIKLATLNIDQSQPSQVIMKLHYLYYTVITKFPEIQKSMQECRKIYH